MQRTTLTLPDELLIALKREARRRDTSVSEIAREALIQHFGLADTGPRKLPFVGIGRSGCRDTSERIDEILDEAWGRASRRSSSNTATFRSAELTLRSSRWPSESGRT